MSKTGPRDDANLAAIRLEWWPRSNWNRWPPSSESALGDRDHALLLFLYNSGARADEAATLTIDRLQLGAQSSVRLHGKGNKFRTCPLWPVTATSLSR